MKRASKLVAVASLLATAPAHADSAAAEALFRDGRVLIKAGKLQQGCDKIAASEKIETSVGTLLNLGDCREKQGKLASAWAAFRQAESLAKRTGGDDKRMAEAGKRAAALEPKLSNLVIEVPSPVDGLVIRRDDEVVERGGWNTPLPVDPTSHVVIAEAPGYKPWQLEVSIDPRSRRRVIQVPKLEPLPPGEAAASAIPAPVIVTQPTTAVLRPRRFSRTWSTTRGVAVAVGVLGAGAIVTGAVFGSRADDLQDRSDMICPSTVCDSIEGLRLNDDARKNASRANLAFALGGAAAVTASVMWFLGKPDDELVVAPMMDRNQGGVSLSGRF